MDLTVKYAILRALIDSEIVNIMPKTTGDQVYLTDTITVSAKIAELVSAVNLRAKIDDVNTELNTRITALKQEILGDVPVEAYDTFTELAAYIAEHKDVADALTAAIGNKVDKTSIGALAGKNVVSENELDEALLTLIKGKADSSTLGTLASKNSVSTSELEATLLALINGKADASTLGSLAKKNTVSESDLDNTLALKLNESGGGNSGAGNCFYVSATRPEGITTKDVWFHINQ